LLDRLGLTEGERRLLAHTPRWEFPSLTSRLDGFLNGDSLKFVEYNGECPAGIGYSDVLQEVFLEFPPLAAMNANGRIKPLYCRRNILTMLLDAWKKAGGSGKPRIAIIDWRDVPTRFEFELFQEFFSTEGYACLVVDPR